MDFQHQNPHDGDYWNATTRHFTADQWRGKVREMATLGLKHIVIMSSALDDKAFYPSTWMDHWDLACPDPIGAVLQEAGACGLGVFVSGGFYKHTTEETSDAPDYYEWHTRLTAELLERYGKEPAFQGWYVPNEADIHGHYSDGYMQFMSRYGPYLKQLAPGKTILIAPYGTRYVQEDDKFVSQLCSLGAAGVDYIAYQDEVGVRKTKVEELDAIYARLRRLHDRASAQGTGPALWADTEIFEFEGATYASALIPAALSRIQAQLAAIAPYVDTMLCYQTHGLINPPDSPQFCGHPDSARLWTEYTQWIAGR
jgi:hypothetical protein